MSDLTSDCRLAAQVLLDTGTFETGQQILIEAADLIESLTARAESAEAEVARLTDIRLVRFENGQFDFRGGPVQAIAAYFAKVMQKDERGEYFNNMEVSFTHPDAGEMVLTCQRRDGLTMAEQRKAAEVELAALRATMATVRKDERERICTDLRELMHDLSDDEDEEASDAILTAIERTRAMEDPT